jgi:hypothetical protein
MNLYPNCSESTARLRVDKLSNFEVTKLKKELMQFIIEKQNDDDEDKRLKIKNRNIEDVEADYYNMAYETSIYEDKIWGIKTLSIKGDFPFNHSEDLSAFVSEHNLEAEYEED